MSEMSTAQAMEWEQQSLPPEIDALTHYFLTEEEIRDIYHQLRSTCIPNRQVLWSGMPREDAQYWADRHGFQTLTTAMGPLMDTSNGKCPKHKKSPKAWSKYVHGASILFAWYIAGGDVATVLSQPPPARFHPSGRTYYQALEEPILMGKFGNSPVKRINVVHPTVYGAENYTYQMWPQDSPFFWKELFGENQAKVQWRLVKASLRYRTNALASNKGNRGIICHS